MTAPLPLPEQLLALARDFTRHNDNLYSLAGGIKHAPNTFTDRTADTQYLSRIALEIRDGLYRQRFYDTPGIQSAGTRLTQLAQLATDAADLLIDAVDILDEIPEDSTSPATGLEDNGPIFANQEAVKATANHLSLAMDLTGMGADDCVTTASVVVTELRRQHVLPAHQHPAFSPAQDAALRAVARGQVTIKHNKPLVSSDVRVSLSTLRSLETRGLVAREECPRLLHDARMHLTRDGLHGLAATLDGPQRPAPTAGPVHAPAKTAANRPR